MQSWINRKRACIPSAVYTSTPAYLPDPFFGFPRVWFRDYSPIQSDKPAAQYDTPASQYSETHPQISVQYNLTHPHPSTIQSITPTSQYNTSTSQYNTPTSQDSVTHSTAHCPVQTKLLSHYQSVNTAAAHIVQVHKSKHICALSTFLMPHTCTSKEHTHEQDGAVPL